MTLSQRFEGFCFILKSCYVLLNFSSAREIAVKRIPCMHAEDPILCKVYEYCFDFIAELVTRSLFVSHHGCCTDIPGLPVSLSIFFFIFNNMDTFISM